LHALRRAEAGTPVGDVPARGVWEANFYVWKTKYANLNMSELRKLKAFQSMDPDRGSYIETFA